MPRLAKIALNNTVVFVSTSIEEGIMLPPNALVNLIIEKSLAQAQAHHPITVCDYIVEGTHVHLFLVVTNPDDLKGFMERFKSESAHAINRVMGRKKRTIWCEGYDSPILLDLEAAINKKIYLYENPAKDGLVDSINGYPGSSSWKHFINHKTTVPTFYIPRDAFRRLPIGVLTEDDYRAEARLLKRSCKKSKFVITPNAWMRIFGITDPKEIKEINDRIIKTVLEREQMYREQRKANNKTAIGASKLIATPIGAHYIPQRKGKRTFCISTKNELRRDFIRFAKDLIVRGKEVFIAWKRGENVPYPIGLYPPSMPKLANLFNAF